MKIAHVALYVEDLEAMRAFYVRHFAAEASEKYHNPRTGLQTYFLKFGEGARLELMYRPEMTAKAYREQTLGYAHLAFGLGSKEAVDRLTRLLQENGWPLMSGPRVTGEGYYESVLADPEGNLIELVA